MEGPMNFEMLIIQGILGIVAFVGFSWLISENRRKIEFKFVILGILIQLLTAFIILKVPTVNSVFLWLSAGIEKLKCATCEGTKFLFGYLGGGDSPFPLKDGASVFIFAFQPLPMVMVISALSMLLFHWKILPIVVRGFSWALR